MAEPLLYHPSVAAALSHDFLRGGDPPDLSTFRQKADLGTLTDEGICEIDTDLVSSLISHAVELKISGTELDAWLAPRLHSVLRIPRFLAADQRFWSWVAIELCRPYVQARWAGSEADAVSAWRYTGPLLRNAVSRLWWGADMTRNGPSYDYVAPLFKRVRTAQWALELKYSWYRPAPIAFVSVAEGVDEGERLSDDDMRLLSKRINAYLSLKVLEAVAVDEGVDQQYDIEWRKHTPSLAEVVKGTKLKGPADGYASGDAIGSLKAWFQELVMGP